jgi:hypothetical protein
VNRVELGALRDAIDTILNWPDSVRDQIAQWLQTDASKPSPADPSRLSRSRSNRRRGFKPGVEEAAARERALLEAMRDHPEAGVVQWARTTRCDKSASLHAARSIGQARRRRAGRQRSLAARRGEPYDAAVALTAEEEAELLAPVAAPCPPWLTPIAASTSRDVLLRLQRVRFPEMRGTVSVARFG